MRRVSVDPGRAWGRMVLVVLCAALSFGGTFTCSGSTHDDDDDDRQPQNPPVQQPVVP